MRQIAAVEARIEIDLRVGAAMTRFQTMRLQRKIPQLRKKVISYGKIGLIIKIGSCQFPTLGFVVERYLEAQHFIPEKFWKIRVEITFQTIKVEFIWDRNRLFNEFVAIILYENCVASNLAIITKITKKPTTKKYLE